MTNKEATQEFIIRDVLVSHCGEVLSAGLIERIRAELLREIRSGKCSWAFKEESIP